MVQIIESKKGEKITVDKKWYEMLKYISWGVYGGYASHYDKKNRKFIKMHNVIMDPIPNNMVVDHKNLDKLDNRSSNLRFASSQQNSFNRKRGRKNPLHKYKGIRKSKNNKYQAHITVNGKNIHLGTYDTIEHAAYAYDISAIKEHGEFANINGVKKPLNFKFKEKNKSSKYKYIHWCNRAKKWVANIYIDNKVKRKHFKFEIEAKKYVDESNQRIKK